MPATAVRQAALQPVLSKKISLSFAAGQVRLYTMPLCDSQWRNLPWSKIFILKRTDAR